MNILISILIITFILSFLFRSISRSKQEQSGLPKGSKVVYSDTDNLAKVEKPLFSRKYSLTGKPDYIIKTIENGQEAIVPVEVKPTRKALKPYDADIMQLAAYMLLTEETYNRDVKYGLIKYKNNTFQIDFTEKLREHLLALLVSIKTDLNRSDVEKNHDEIRRCRGCGYYGQCSQALG